MKGNLKSRAQNRTHAKGLWGYCIRPVTASALKMKGIAAKTAVCCLRFKDIEAVVSDVPMDQFAGKEMKNKLENNPKWLERSLRLHHNTIVKAGIMGPVIPMKFGMLFRTKRNFTAMLKNDYKKFKNLLLKLKDKQELGVKVYLERKKFIEQLKSEDDGIQQFEKRRSTLTEGMKWYIDKKTEAAIDEKFDNAMERCLAEITDVIKQLAEKVVINDLPPSYNGEANGKEIILNGACLIGNEHAKSFKERLEKSLVKLHGSGFTVEITGPWPPYNFI